MKPISFSMWRLLNAVLIILMLIGPWTINPGSILPFDTQPLQGWQIIENATIGMLSFIISDLPPPAVWILLIPFLLVAYGCIFALVYTIVSITTFLTKKRTAQDKYIKILLIFSSLILLNIPLEFFIKVAWPPLWGYWLGVLGLLSSIALEWSIFKSHANYP